MEEKLLGKFEAVSVKFASYDDAVRLLQEFANRQPTTEAVNGDVKALKELVASNLSGLKELIEAKFEGNKTALDAALKTQKEGSDKIESNFTKQFENIITNSNLQTKSFDDKISDIKDRFNTSQGRGTGRGDVVGFIAIGVAIVAGLIGIFARFGN